MSIVNRQGRLTAVKGFPSTLSDGTAITGAVIDRLGYQSALLIFSYEASSGTPTSASAALKVQDDTASDGSTAADYAVLETAKNIKTAGIAQYMIDLSGANRYLKVIEDTTYVDGSSPKNQVSCEIVLFDKDVDADTTTVYGR
ncbi:MAG TPA: hypothetical protein PLH98_16445 [Ruminococcus flavefaciens]|nr:hypothetical protein [Ruminococcus flavefaciens]